MSVPRTCVGAALAHARTFGTPCIARFGTRSLGTPRCAKASRSAPKGRFTATTLSQFSSSRRVASVYASSMKRRVARLQLGQCRHVTRVFLQFGLGVYCTGENDVGRMSLVSNICTMGAMSFTACLHAEALRAVSLARM